MRSLLSIALFSILLPAATLAQTVDNNMGITNTEGRSILSITPSKGSNNGFSLSVSGFEIGFNMPREKHELLDPVLPNMQPKQVNNKYCTPIPVIEFGFTGFPQGEYKAYNHNGDGFMKYQWSRSTHVQWNVLRFSESFNRSNTFGFSSALGLAWDRYFFNNYFLDDMSTSNHSQSCFPVGSAKIRTFSLNIPIIFGYNYRSFGLGLGVYGNFVLSRSTKVAYHPAFRDTVRPYVNKPQAGATLRIKFKFVSLFANYTLTNIFESGTAPDDHPITFGIGIW